MKGSRIVKLALFVMLVFGGGKTAFADIAYSFTTIDAPGATNGTVALGINDSGQIVGYYTDGLGTHGFLYTGGSFTTIEVPGATNTAAHGINDSGQIVGTSTLGAFLDTAGNFTTIEYPGTTGSTVANGINDSGQIVGTANTGGTGGFLDTGGSFTRIDFPGPTVSQTVPEGINDSGQIVGYYRAAFVQPPVQGFLYYPNTTIHVPGATKGSIAYGINDSGQIVGQYFDNNGTHSFLDTSGSFTTINVPGAGVTLAQGINGSGQIVGYYILAGINHGFLATPCGASVITDAFASPNVLWPPNHQFVDVAINYAETSNCTSTCTLSVTSNEPGPDEWIIVDAHHVQLLAERNGNGSGRVYTITITCTNAGGTSTTAVTVLVPHDQGSLSTKNSR